MVLRRILSGLGGGVGRPIATVKIPSATAPPLLPVLLSGSGPLNFVRFTRVPPGHYSPVNIEKIKELRLRI